MTLTVQQSPYSAMLVDVPEGQLGNVRVERFEVVDDISLKLATIRDRRTPRPGIYTRMIRDGALWMSDTPAEQRDHWEPVNEMSRRGGRVLIMGLGLGMVVKAALAIDKVEHIDIIELDQDVIDLVGPHYLRDERVHIHQGDALTFKWPPNTHWNVVWHDIWLEMSENNLPEMAKLKRSYGRRADWQGCWGQSEILYRRRQYSGLGW